MKLRRKARMAVLQALYEVDVTGHPAGDALDARLGEQQLPPAVESFARGLMAGVLAHRHQLNTLIARHAPEWPLDQMAVVDRNILRIAIFELSNTETDTPAKVAINEALELSRQFGEGNAKSFINGILDAVAKALETGGLTRPAADSTSKSE